MFWKSIIILICVFAIAMPASALTYTADVEATVGTGDNSATIAIDFDLDNYFLHKE